jgi:hypothetical protein
MSLIVKGVGSSGLLFLLRDYFWRHTCKTAVSFSAARPTCQVQSGSRRLAPASVSRTVSARGRKVRPAATWLRLLGLGLLLHTLTQGAQFLGLAYLPAVTVNLMLSLSSVVVALVGIVLLAERPSLKQ